MTLEDVQKRLNDIMFSHGTSSPLAVRVRDLLREVNDSLGPNRGIKVGSRVQWSGLCVGRVADFYRDDDDTLHAAVRPEFQCDTLVTVPVEYIEPRPEG